MPNRRSNSAGSRRTRRPRAYASEVRTRAKQETRAALLKAALSLFADKGLDVPTIDDICVQAGYTRGAFYAHFADRDELMVEAMKSRRHATVDALLQLLGQDVTVPSLLDLLASLVQSGVFPAKGRVRAAEFLQACRRSKELGRAQLALLDEMKQRLADMVRRDQAAGVLRRDLDPDAFGALLVVLEAGVEVMADLGWKYDVCGAAKLLSRASAQASRSAQGEL